MLPQVGIQRFPCPLQELAAFATFLQKCHKHLKRPTALRSINSSLCTFTPAVLGASNTTSHHCYRYLCRCTLAPSGASIQGCYCRTLPKSALCTPFHIKAFFPSTPPILLAPFSCISKPSQMFAYSDDSCNRTLLSCPKFTRPYPFC